jgi:membrane protease YdiL (CAAX protease family)
MGESDVRVLVAKDGPPKRPPGPLARLWEHTVARPLRQVEDEARAHVAAARGVDRKTVVVLLTATVALLLQQFCVLTGPDRVLGWLRLAGLGPEAGRFADWSGQFVPPRLSYLTYWCAGAFVCYFVLPVLVILLVLRENPLRYGVKLRGAFQDFWLYAVMLAVVLPLVWYVSTTAEFQRTYPFYQPARGEALWPDREHGWLPNLWRWELLYALQFFSLEFFFRGFLVHGTRHRFGVYSVLVMTIPYCMIHFGKPMPEATGSIVAGVVLGLMSLKTRSIWMGAAVHVTVAWSMDLTSLWRQGYFH